MFLYYHKFFVNARLFPKLFFNFFLRKIPISREKNLQQITSNKLQPSSSPSQQKHRKTSETATHTHKSNKPPQPSTNKHLRHYASIILKRHCLNTETILRILTIFRRAYLFKEPTLQYQYFEQILWILSLL